PRGLGAQPHGVVSVGAPGACRKTDGCASRVLGHMARPRDGSDVGLPGQLAVDVAQEVGALEPPVSEELGIERDRDHAIGTGRVGRRDPAEERSEVPGVSVGLAPRDPRIVPLLAPEIDAVARPPPELEPAGPADLVELEILAGAGIAV